MTLCNCGALFESENTILASGLDVEVTYCKHCKLLVECSVGDMHLEGDYE